MQKKLDEDLLNYESSIIGKNTNSEFNLKLKQSNLYDADIHIRVSWGYHAFWQSKTHKGKVIDRGLYFGNDVNGFEVEHNRIIEDANKNKIYHNKHINEWKDLKESSFIKSNQNYLIQYLGTTSYSYSCSTCKASGLVYCSSCDGYGKKNCHNCGGKGFRVYGRQVSETNHYGVQTFRTEYNSVPCGICAGSGRLACDTCNGCGKVNCDSCHGHGELTQVRDYEVKACPTIRIHVNSEHSAHASLIQKYLQDTALNFITNSINLDFHANYENYQYICDYKGAFSIIENETYLMKGNQSIGVFESLSYSDKTLVNVVKPSYFDEIFIDELNKLLTINSSEGSIRDDLLINFLTNDIRSPVIQYALEHLAKSSKPLALNNLIENTQGYISKTFAESLIDNLDKATNVDYLKYDSKIFKIGTLISTLLTFILIDILSNLFLTQRVLERDDFPAMFIGWGIAITGLIIFATLLRVVASSSSKSVDKKNSGIPEAYRREGKSNEVYSNIMRFKFLYLAIAIVWTFIAATQYSPFKNLVSDPIKILTSNFEQDNHSYTDSTDIYSVQSDLIEDGYDLETTGELDAPTRQAIIDFLSNQGVDLENDDDETLLKELYLERRLPYVINDINERFSEK